MKTLLFSVAGLAISLSLFAQSSSGLIEINNVSATVQPTGHLFWDLQGQNQFNIPANSDTRTIFASYLSMGAMSPIGQLHLFGDTYGANGLDVQPGPLMDDQHYATESPNWDQVWSISRATIDKFRAWYDAGIQDALNGTNTQSQLFPAYVIPDEITDWPAHGDVSLGQNYYMAPFFDANGDGWYNPSDGEYPVIMGDHALWFVYNDDLPHMATGGSRFGVQISVMVYGFDCDVSDALHNTLFVHYDIFNPANGTDYHDVYLSSWVDFDIGNSQDDYVACDVERGAFYAYNGDDIDEDLGDLTGYGNSPPAQAVVILKGPKQESDNIDNSIGGYPGESVNGTGFADGIVDNERLGLSGFMSHTSFPGTPFSSPAIAPDYYNAMRGLWQDGTPLTHGGSGYNTLPGSTETKFMFPGNSNPLGYGAGANQNLTSWLQSEITGPHDVRGMGIVGPFEFDAGSVQGLDLAFVYGRKTGGTALESVDVMKDNIDEVRQIYTDGVTPCGFPFFWTEVAEEAASTEQLEIFPNPATDQVWLRGLDQSVTNYRILSMTGQLVRSGMVGAEQASIDIRDLPTGIYLLQVDTDTQRNMHRLIKR